MIFHYLNISDHTHTRTEPSKAFLLPLAKARRIKVTSS